MHGVFHKGFKDFVIAEYGDDAWRAAREASGVDRQVYLPVNYYPDEEFISLIDGLSGAVDDSAFTFLEAYGAFLAGRLVDTYGRLVDDDWDALEVVANVEVGVHERLRTHDEDLTPPALECERDGDVVTVYYRSPRRLCPVARGLVRGVGEEYGTPLDVTERQCVHEGDAECELVVRPT
jgi:predicted hydrocarbon binding protein